MAVLKGFADGAQAVVDINDGDIVWTFDLDGFTAAMSDALKTATRLRTNKIIPAAACNQAAAGPRKESTEAQ